MDKITLAPGRTLIAGAPDCVDAMVLADLARSAGPGPGLLHIAVDDSSCQRLADALAFFAPDVTVRGIPAWDCLPYDRVSPNGEIQSRRAALLSELAEAPGHGAPPRALLTTVNAVLQRVAPPEIFADRTFSVHAGGKLNMDDFLAYMASNGYARVGTVRERGEFAVRGGIIDIFPPTEEPVRLDLFGDEVEAIRSFDPVSQRSVGTRERFELRPVSEIVLDPATVERFRAAYVEAFGAGATHDPLYESISAGRPHGGMEHWLPLFHVRLATLFDYLPDDATVTLDHQADEVVGERLEQIADYYQARQSLMSGGERDLVYRPLPPARLFLDEYDWRARLAERRVGAFSPFAAPEHDARAINMGGRRDEELATARADPKANVLDAARESIAAIHAAGRRACIAAYSAGSRERLAPLLKDHGIEGLMPVESWPEALALAPRQVALIVLGLERGVSTPDFSLITEQDLLGDRLTRRPRRRRRSDAFLTELSTLEEGDLVVHEDHGIGRYEGLETLDVAGAPHDCLLITYEGGDKLFVPVENMEVLSRYGSEEPGAQLDRLGGAAWQARKARVGKRVRDLAGKLIAIAARRELRAAAPVTPPAGIYDEFCARFPYPETDDQQTAIVDMLEDLASGRPMDRLICGDVGFGKTEVALRGALVAVMSGLQVAVVVPTTLLARQHHRTFEERFAGLPVRIGHLSRLVPPKAASAVRHELATGQVDIVIGTHTLLGKSVSFANLGLVVVDEEQRFGVAQKERLKELSSEVHVLTLTATPIPRTLQMALAGVREMSLIATPPVDRLAVRTFVLPYDPVVVREALQRESHRGGQVFYVCPRIEDLPPLHDRLTKLVPEMKIATAHGRMAAAELEAVMTRFYDGAYDILLSTNIIESGLDIPRVNTIIVHRADRFGLAQLYQLRGRVGRSKIRAYAYLTLPTDRPLSKSAERRLEVMQTLDTLGAGFTLASHDMDIRGAGNLLGEEQSGHVREVGIELYQHMLEEAVAAARGDGAAAREKTGWTPQIGIGAPVLIPESYVADLPARLGLYRRIASLIDRGEIDALAAEMIDRFGSLPDEVQNLLHIVAIKRLCLEAGVAKIDAGPKGAILSFHNNDFADPAGLVSFIQGQAGTVKLRPDHTLVYRRRWDDAEARIDGISQLLRQLAEIAA